MACIRCESIMYDAPGAPAATCLMCGAESALDMERERRWLEAIAVFANGLGSPAMRGGSHYNPALEGDRRRAFVAKLGIRPVA